MICFLFYPKKAFEQGLNFRDGMLSKASDFYDDVKDEEIFINLDILENKVGNNLVYLRKISTIKKLGYYKDTNFLNRFKEINEEKSWGIEFQMVR